MLDRRNFMKTCSDWGWQEHVAGSVVGQAQRRAPRKSQEMIDNAASIADVAIADDYKQMMLDNLNEHAKGYEEIHKLHIPNSVEPALILIRAPGMKFETDASRCAYPRRPSGVAAGAPKNLEDWHLRVCANSRSLSCEKGFVACADGRCTWGG